VDLVIFDCDGVLVDSEILANAVLVEHLKPYLPGLDVAGFARRFAGTQDADILATVEREAGITLRDGFLEEIDEAIDQRLADELQPVPGTAEALAAIGLPKAVASNSPLLRVTLSLERTGLTHFFGKAVFVAAMVERPKPHPDLYRHAVAAMGARPERCLVIEDSVTGVAAAAAAGLSVFGFLGAGHIGPGHGERLSAAGAGVLVPDMGALPAAVAAWAGR
jgi:HAD superfamily hydrolase (TIGR01509 family)